MKEGWGLVILEAMAAGLPVVTSDIDVFHEFLTDEQDVLMTGAGNAESLALGLARLVDDDTTRQRLALRGPAVAAAYPWSGTAAQHLEVYRRALSSTTEGEHDQCRAT